MEGKPEILVSIKDSNGNTVRRISGPVKKGFHRIAWDLKYPAPYPVTLGTGEGEGDFKSGCSGEPGGVLPMASPGGLVSDFVLVLLLGLALGSNSRKRVIPIFLWSSKG